MRHADALTSLQPPQQDAILADLGFAPPIMNGLFMIARLPGLVAHVHEEQTTQRPMRKIDPVNHTYEPASESSDA